MAQVQPQNLPHYAAGFVALLVFAIIGIGVVNYAANK